MEAERCPTCDRPSCPMPRYERMSCSEFDSEVGVPGDEKYESFLTVRNDCDAHRVDWRERALKAEALLREARDQLHHGCVVERQWLGSLVDRINAALSKETV